MLSHQEGAGLLEHPAGAIRDGGHQQGVGELGDAVNNVDRNGLIIKAYQQHAPGQQALCFAVDVAHAIELTKQFNEAGIPAGFVVGASTDRKEVLEKFQKKQLKVAEQILKKGLAQSNGNDWKKQLA